MVFAKQYHGNTVFFFVVFLDMYYANSKDTNVTCSKYYGSTIVNIQKKRKERNSFVCNTYYKYYGTQISTTVN